MNTFATRLSLSHSQRTLGSVFSRQQTRLLPPIAAGANVLIIRWTSSDNSNAGSSSSIRLSKLISQHGSNLTISRREAERCIRDGGVTVAGKTVTSPSMLLEWTEAESSIKVNGKLVQFQKSFPSTRVWLCHKLGGEIVSERDPQGRPSLVDKLQRDIPKIHLKPIGRLDIMTEGLILLTNNGTYARQMELPRNQVHRTYRVRLHGKLTPHKLKAMRSGFYIENTRYHGMKVHIETTRKKNSSTNTWLQITCTQGKNRQIRKVLSHLGCKSSMFILALFRVAMY